MRKRGSGNERKFPRCKDVIALSRIYISKVYITRVASFFFSPRPEEPEEKGGIKKWKQGERKDRKSGGRPGRRLSKEDVLRTVLYLTYVIGVETRAVMKRESKHVKMPAKGERRKEVLR